MNKTRLDPNLKVQTMGITSRYALLEGSKVELTLLNVMSMWGTACNHSTIGDIL